MTIDNSHTPKPSSKKKVTFLLKPVESKETPSNMIVHSSEEWRKYGQQIEKGRKEQEKSFTAIQTIIENDQELNKLEKQIEQAVEKYNTRKKSLMETKEFKSEQDKLEKLSSELNEIMKLAMQHFEKEKNKIVQDKQMNASQKQRAIQQLYQSLCNNLFTKEESLLFHQLLFGGGATNIIMLQ